MPSVPKATAGWRRGGRAEKLGMARVIMGVECALGLFCLFYGSLAFTGAMIWGLPFDGAPTKMDVGSIAGIQTFASNFAGVLTTILAGVLLQVTKGSFVIPLLVPGAASMWHAPCPIWRWSAGSSPCGF